MDALKPDTLWLTSEGDYVVAGDPPDREATGELKVMFRRMVDRK